MLSTLRARWPSWRAQIASRLGSRQHRNSLYLTLNTMLGAAVGLLFWLLLVRAVGLGADEVGIGYAVIALGTTAGVLAKGGLDTALLRTVPGASRTGARRLLRLAVGIGASVALALVAAFAVAGRFGWFMPPLSTGLWLLVAAIATLLVLTWLQDAYYLAHGSARPVLQRNLVFSAGRLALPFIVLALAFPYPVSVTWALALLLSALFVAWLGARSLVDRPGRLVPRREFLVSASRNITGSAAEFLPGLLLVPLVLGLAGAAAAAYFGIAWTAASLLFLTSAAISRAALAEMVRAPSGPQGGTIRRAAALNLMIVGPGALAGILLAPFVLGLFGAAYAEAGTPAFMLLCASAVFVAPFYLYLAVLRARESPWALVAFPVAMVAALAVLAPLFVAHFGATGVAAAWVIANAPFGVFAMWRLRRETREVNPLHAPTQLGAPDLE